MASERALIDPTAPAAERQAVAERPASLDGARVALIDGMLNPSSNWGQGLLDGVERHLSARYEDVSFERVSRPQLMPSPPDVWAEAMADGYTALVIAAGD
jgi:hypothetical protein